MSIFNNNLLAGAAAQSGTTTYAIDQSIRFNDDDNAYLSRTISSTSSTTTNTISMWVKRGNLGNSRSGSGSDALGQTLFQSGRNALNFFEVNFGGTTAGAIGTSENALRISSTTGDSIIMKLNTTAIFRDTSAWYHIVAVVDTTNSISTERLRLYVNGNRQTDFTSTTFPSKDTETELFRNTSNVLSVGGWVNPSESVRFFDGYMAEITVINGTALDPSSFGEYNSSGIWVPKDVSGLTFGTNGFYIKGEDSADLGNDSSGNGNDFTPSGLASHDQVSDSPTNNFCTINPPADINSTKNTVSEGNLKTAGSSSSIWHISPCTQILPSGKWYFEARLNTASGNSRFAIGLIPTSPMLTANYGNLPSAVVNSSGFSLQLDNNSEGLLWYEYSSGSGQNVTISVDTDEVGTIGQLAIDVDNQKIWAGINGTYYNSSGGGDGNPSTGSNPTYSGTSNFSTGPLVPFIGNFLNSCQGVLNFGQDGTFAGTETAQGNSDGNGIGNFKYSVPTGFKAICTKNLGS